MSKGLLEVIWIASAKGEPMVSLERAELEAGLGLVGDRYHEGKGTFSRWQRPNRAVSLIESEVLHAVEEDAGIDLSEGRHRRNLVTSGISVSDLIGGNFRIGTVLFRASATCPPCRYLERLLGPGTFEALRNCGGIRAEVLESGLIKSGDVVIPVGARSMLP